MASPSPRDQDQVQSQRADGTWGPAIPEPLWVGWRLRVAQCDCGARFKRQHRRCQVLDDHACTAREQYRNHWWVEHSGTIR